MERKKAFIQKLKMLTENGVILRINSIPVTPEQVAKRIDILRDKYKPRFYYSDDGNISELDYICIA